MRLTAGAAAGKYTGGRRPRYGYTPDLEGQLQPEPGDQRTVARIQRMRAKGASLRKIGEAVCLHAEPSASTALLSGSGLATYAGPATSRPTATAPARTAPSSVLLA